MTIKGILFDNDGTLVDTHDLLLESFQYATRTVLGAALPDDVLMAGVKIPLVVNALYYCDPDGHSDYVGTTKELPVDDRTPEIRHLSFERIVCTNAEYCGAYLTGLPEMKISQVSFRDVSISYALDAGEGVPVMMDHCPICRKRGVILENVKKAVFRNFILEGQEGEEITAVGTDSLVREP